MKGRGRLRKARARRRSGGLEGRWLERAEIENGEWRRGATVMARGRSRRRRCGQVGIGRRLGKLTARNAGVEKRLDFNVLLSGSRPARGAVTCKPGMAFKGGERRHGGTATARRRHGQSPERSPEKAVTWGARGFTPISAFSRLSDSLLLGNDSSRLTFGSRSRRKVSAPAPFRMTRSQPTSGTTGAFYGQMAAGAASLA